MGVGVVVRTVDLTNESRRTRYGPDTAALVTKHVWIEFRARRSTRHDRDRSCGNRLQRFFAACLGQTLDPAACRLGGIMMVSQLLIETCFCNTSD